MLARTVHRGRGLSAERASHGIVHGLVEGARAVLQRSPCLEPQRTAKRTTRARETFCIQRRFWK
jgi:hypothetical protein